MTRSSQFIDCRIAVIQSASDIYGSSSSQVTAARAAFDAVGITDGTGTNIDPTLQVNPGNQFIVSSDVNPLDSVRIYISNTAANSFSPLTTTPHRKKISVTDDGSIGYFADSAGFIHQVNMNPNNVNETILFQSNPDFPPFDNVAVSKDGDKLAMLTTMADTSIWIISFSLNRGLIYRLSNPTTANGVSTGDVLFADVINWDLSGENVLYDGFNVIRSATGDDLEYWDLGLIRVWDNATNNFGDGRILKLFSGLEPGESIGNAVFSKNSPNVIAFDFFDSNNEFDPNDDENMVMAANIETGAVGTISQNSQLGFPTYSVDDGQLLFDTPLQDNQGNVFPGIARVDLAADKINPASNVVGLIRDGRWSEWYADGVRVLTDIEDFVEAGSFALFPNPATDRLRVEYNLKETAEVQLEIMDVMGRVYARREATTRGIGMNTEEMMVGELPGGIYLLQIKVEDAVRTLKFVKS